MFDINYKDKICVVTGSASGIGLATVKMLVELGAKVYALDVNETKVEGIEASIITDLSNKDSIDQAFNQIPYKVDSFFGVAGLSGAKTNYYTTFTVNFIANKYITEEYLSKRMIKGCSIAYVTSTGGSNWQKYKKEYLKFINTNTWEEAIEVLHKQAKPDTLGMMAYPLSKRAMNYYTNKAAIDFGSRGIRVNAILPGSTDTGMKKEFEVEAGGEKELISHTGVIQRLATPEEMAAPLIFLNSSMAGFISGVTLVCDYASTSMIELGLRKDQMNVPVGLKLYNTKFMQKQFAKQLEPLNNEKK